MFFGIYGVKIQHCELYPRLRHSLDHRCAQVRHVSTPVVGPTIVSTQKSN